MHRVQNSKWLSSKPHVMVLSLLLAFILWAVVVLSVNRTASRTIDGIEVEIPTSGTSFQARGLEIIDNGEKTYTVSISVSGDRTVIGGLKPEDFAVTPGCTLETIALINARGDMPMSGIQSENGLWYNCSSVDSGLPVTVAPCLISSPGLPIGGAAPVSIGTELYAMPNPSTSQDDANVQPWSPRQTRIAIGLRIDGVLQWYRIDLPAMQGNTHYRIENVYITGPGASVPDLGTDRVNLDFSVALRPWGSETSNVDFGY